MIKDLYQFLFKSFFCSRESCEETKKGDVKMKNDLDVFIEECSLHLNEPVIFDTVLAPLIKMANLGDVNALIDLGCAFMDGKNAKVNDDLAISYFERLFDSLEEHQYLARYYAQHNMACIEARRGNYEELKLRFYNITKLMYKEFPFEEWRFEAFQWMKEVVDQKNDNSDV